MLRYFCADLQRRQRLGTRLQPLISQGIRKTERNTKYVFIVTKDLLYYLYSLAMRALSKEHKTIKYSYV